MIQRTRRELIREGLAAMALASVPGVGVTVVSCALVRLKTDSKKKVAP